MAENPAKIILRRGALPGQEMSACSGLKGNVSPYLHFEDASDAVDRHPDEVLSLRVCPD